MKKKIINVLLSFAMVLAILPAAAGYAAENSIEFTSLGKVPASISNFTDKVTYKSGAFNDIGSGEWYDDSVKRAVELGIMNGKGEGVFDPTGDIRISEALKMACVVHSIYNGGTGEFTQGDVWYKVYVDYAIANGIIASAGFPDNEACATRAQMAYIFSNALPESELGAINTVTALPDVYSATPYSNSIFTLYRAGVLTGNDSAGTFGPSTNINRAQAAAIITRIAVPSERKTLALTPEQGNSGREAIIKSVLDRYNSIQSSLGSCEVKYFGTSAEAYYIGGKLLMLREYPEYDPDTDGYLPGDFDERWYYYNSEVFFILMTDPATNGEYSLYFNNGELIRWTDPDGNTHDSGDRWNEMQGHYAHAEEQCDSLAVS